MVTLQSPPRGVNQRVTLWSKGVIMPNPHLDLSTWWLSPSGARASKWSKGNKEIPQHLVIY